MRNDPLSRNSRVLPVLSVLTLVFALPFMMGPGCAPPIPEPQEQGVNQVLGGGVQAAGESPDGVAALEDPAAEGQPQAALDPSVTDLGAVAPEAGSADDKPQAPVTEPVPPPPVAVQPEPPQPTPPLRMLAGGGNVAPIARWDVVPNQRINAGETLNVGVVAFSKFGISKVTFSIGEAATEVTTMTHNPHSGVYEYWLPISADAFATDGRITVNATVYGGDGGTRTLPGLPLVVNPKGTLPQPQAWVSTSGNDAGGAVNNPGRPFRTIGSAMKAIHDSLGGKVDGGIIRLTPGTHHADNAGIWSELPTVSEWVTITTAEGGSVDNTVLRSNLGIFVTSKLAIRGITLDRSDGGGVVIDSTGAYGPSQTVWVDGCRLIGSGQFNRSSSLLGNNIGKILMTECAISNCDYPTLNSNACKLARGLAIKNISNDAFQNVPMVVNCTVDNIDPGDTGAHADCIGDWRATGDQCRIVYNLRATNLHYQGIWNNQDSSYSTPLDGYAFVNVSMQLADPIRPGGGGSAYAFGTDHLLFWNCTFSSRTAVPNSHAFGLYVDGSPRQQTNMTNVSVVGNVFGYCNIQNNPMLWVDMSDWSNNHYGQGGFGPGDSASSGDPGLNQYAQPTGGSPLFGRLGELVTPADAVGTLRSIPGTVGAFQP